MLQAGKLHCLSSSPQLRLLMVFVVLASPLPAMAQNWDPWTTVGSAGTLDTSDKGVATFSGPWIGMDRAAPPSTVVIRYNVVSVDGLIQGGARHFLNVRYIDNGNQARIVVYLRELDLSTGGITTRITFDSDLFPASSSGQTQTITGGCTFPLPPAPWAYDFEKKAYYLEAHLIKTGTSGNPWLAAIQLRDAYCVG